MKGNLKKLEKSEEAVCNDFLEEELQKWLTTVKNSPKKLDTALKELRRFNRQLLEEKEQAQRICFFEKSVEQLLHNCFPNLTKPEEIKIQLWKGHNYETFGDWGKALSAYQKVIDICDSEALTSYKAEAYRWIGHIQVMQNRWSEAIKSYQISLKLTQDNGDQKNKAYVYSGLAYYYFERAELKKAVSYWEKALELAERLNEIRLLAQTNNNLGAVANVQGLWEKALAYFSKSLPRFEKIGESRGLAETYHNVAMTYADAERWSEAGAHYEISYQLAKETGDVRLQATVKLNRAVLFMAIGDLYFAEALCQQALRRYLQLEDHLGQADAYKFLGMINSKKQQWDTAKSYFEKSIQTTRKFKNPLCEAETHMEFGQMWKQKGNKKLAQKQLEQALSLFTQLKVKKEIEKVKHEIAEL